MLNNGQQQRHFEMLVLACVVAVASIGLEVQANGQVGLRGISGFTLPPLCLSHEWFGIDCPGCGLTRSFVHLAHGHLYASWRAHHLGWMLAAILLFQIPYRIHSLFVLPDNLLSIRTRHRIGQFIIGSLICNWFVQIFF